jgi:hypothetical protein
VRVPAKGMTDGITEGPSWRRYYPVSNRLIHDDGHVGSYRRDAIDVRAAA